MCRQTDNFSTEHQERYQPNKFNAIQAKKEIKPGSNLVHSSKKASQRKTRKVIESELMPSTVADKENSQYSNSHAGEIRSLLSLFAVSCYLSLVSYKFLLTE